MLGCAVLASGTFASAAAADRARARHDPGPWTTRRSPSRRAKKQREARLDDKAMIVAVVKMAYADIKQGSFIG
jgi:hypothetical protein